MAGVVHNQREVVKYGRAANQQIEAIHCAAEAAQMSFQVGEGFQHRGDGQHLPGEASAEDCYIAPLPGLPDRGAIGYAKQQLSNRYFGQETIGQASFPYPRLDIKLAFEVITQMLVSSK